MVQTPLHPFHSTPSQHLHNVAVETLTCVYHPLEDRLLLALNYQNAATRQDFWITRSFLLKLLPHLFTYSSCNHTLEAIKPSTNPTTSTTDSDLFALTQKTPILLESIDISTSDTQVILTFKNQTYDISYTSNLNTHAFEGFVKIVTQAAPSFEWGIQNW